MEISVVTAVYNGQEFLAAAIQSILNQTFDDFELIIVDDGSTDRTVSIIEGFAARDGRVRLLRQQRGGCSAALNYGIAEAKGNWIARMDGDDIAVPHRLATQIQAARSDPRVVLWGSFAQHINRDGKILGLSKTGPTSVDHFEKLMACGGDVHLVHPSAMLRRDVLLEVGGYDSCFDDCEDFELFERMSRRGAVVALTEPLLQYRVHATSVSMIRFLNMRRLTRFIRARKNALRKGKILDLPAWEQGLRQRSRWANFVERMDDTAGFHYRKGGLAFGGGKWWAACRNLTIAASLNPCYTFARLWNQVLAAKMQRLLGRSVNGGA